MSAHLPIDEIAIAHQPGHCLFIFRLAEQDNIVKIDQIIFTALQLFLDVVTDIRGIGLLAGIDVAQSKAPGQRGTNLQKKLFWSGLHVKFTGDSGIVAPPLVSDRAVIDEIHKILKDVLSQESV